MTTGNLYFDCFIIGVLGVITHCLIKANSLQKDAQAAKVEFGFKEYLEKDWFTISLSAVSVIIWLFLFEESIAVYAKLNDYIKYSFFGVGLLGSYLIQQAFGKGKKAIRDKFKSTNE